MKVIGMSQWISNATALEIHSNLFSMNSVYLSVIHSYEPCEIHNNTFDNPESSLDIAVGDFSYQQIWERAYYAVKGVTNATFNWWGVATRSGIAERIRTGVPDWSYSLPDRHSVKFEPFLTRRPWVASCSKVANCSHHGECVLPDTCVCHIGWAGTACDKCDENYFGPRCRAPTVLKDSFYEYISESASVGETVLTVKAKRPDNITVAYTITAGNGDRLFGLHRESGELTLLGLVDHETTPKYHLTVSASVVGVDARYIPTVYAAIEITVTDVNDNRPTFSSGDEHLTFNMSELWSDDHIATVHAVDRDTGYYNSLVDLQISVSPDTGATFEINETGAVFVSRVNTAGEYDVLVTATDSGRPPLNATKRLFVTIKKDKRGDYMEMCEYTDVASREQVLVFTERNARQRKTCGCTLRRNSGEVDITVSGFQCDSDDCPWKVQFYAYGCLRDEVCCERKPADFTYHVTSKWFSVRVMGNSYTTGRTPVVINITGDMSGKCGGYFTTHSEDFCRTKPATTTTTTNSPAASTTPHTHKPTSPRPTGATDMCLWTDDKDSPKRLNTFASTNQDPFEKTRCACGFTKRPEAEVFINVTDFQCDSDDCPWKLKIYDTTCLKEEFCCARTPKHFTYRVPSITIFYIQHEAQSVSATGGSVRVNVIGDIKTSRCGYTYISTAGGKYCETTPAIRTTTTPTTVTSTTSPQSSTTTAQIQQPTTKTPTEGSDMCHWTDWKNNPDHLNTFVSTNQDPFEDTRCACLLSKRPDTEVFINVTDFQCDSDGCPWKLKIYDSSCLREEFCCERTPKHFTYRVPSTKIFFFQHEAQSVSATGGSVRVNVIGDIKTSRCGYSHVSTSWACETTPAIRPTTTPTTVTSTTSPQTSTTTAQILQPTTNTPTDGSGMCHSTESWKSSSNHLNTFASTNQDPFEDTRCACLLSKRPDSEVFINVTDFQCDSDDCPWKLKIYDWGCLREEFCCERTPKHFTYRVPSTKTFFIQHEAQSVSATVGSVRVNVIGDIEKFRCGYTYISTLRAKYCETTPAIRPTTTPTTVTSTTSPQSSTTTAQIQQPTTKTPTEGTACYLVDIVFTVDTAGSIVLENWSHVTAFINRFIARMDISRTCARLSIVTFGNAANVQFDLRAYDNAGSLRSAIERIDVRSQPRNFAGGIRKVRSDVFQARSGDRRSAPSMCVLMTDGTAGVEKQAALAEVSRAKADGINMHVIGIGRNVRMSELSSMSSTEAIHINDFVDLDGDETQQKLFSFMEDFKQTAATTTTTTTTTTEQPTTTRDVAAFSWQCSFEGATGRGGICDMTQSSSDNFDWTIGSGATPSSDTGPSSGYGGSGYYIYIEASNPRRQNDKAMIMLPAFNRDGDYCLSFNYNMNGWHINTLQVVKRVSSSGHLVHLWTKEGNKGPQWHSAEITANLYSSDQLAFIGIRGAEYSGDIAVDNVSVRGGRC